MKIQTLVVGRLQTNCHLVIAEESKEAIIIDPGDDADYITRILADEKVKPTKIIATHGHFDHILATTELQLAYNIPFFIHKKDEFLVREMSKSARHFTRVEAGPPPKVDSHLKDTQNIKIGDLNLKVIETPGHTPGSICLFSKKERKLIAGDLIFADGGVGRTDFSYSSQKNLEDSLGKILKLPGNTKILSGHGPETTIADERSYHEM